MFKNPLLLIALALTGPVASWGIIDTAGLAGFSATLTGILFTSRSWFIMLSVSLLLILSIWLAISPYGRIKLGRDDDEPEFSAVSWLTMLFAAGMGVGLLFWGTAEPLSSVFLLPAYQKGAPFGSTSWASCWCRDLFSHLLVRGFWQHWIL